MADNKFFFLIEGNQKNILKQLDVDSSDVIENADGEVDCPLDRVLRKHQMGFNDLFAMDVNTIKFVLKTDSTETTLQSIPFTHLVYQP